MTLESRDLIGGNGLRTLEVMSHVNMLHESVHEQSDEKFRAGVSLALF